ncbi:MAG: potassium channel family protein [Mangrovicoccus sp.]|nr:potassium channel family protein [Mangrovicoccus sp.]
MRKAIAANRWAILLGALLVTLVLDAALAQALRDTSLVELVVMVMGLTILGAVVFAVDHPRSIDVAALCILLIYGGFAIANIYETAAWIDQILLSTTIMVLVGGMVMTFLQLIREMDSDREKLCSGVFGYFLTAMLWAYLYWRLESVVPGSMRFPEQDLGGSSTYIYFSLVTMTTLGYGDIAPLQPLPRMLAALQAAFGTLYIAVMIGQIVGRFRR